jgi:hypothetical protein
MIPATALLHRLALVATLALFPFLAPASAQTDESTVFELRTYTATPGNLDALLARFRDHTMRIFAKHGMTNIGYWVPTEGERAGNTLIYLLQHDSREQANASWQAFVSDPEWREVAEESNVNGPILDNVERVFLQTTDFSPLQ